MDYIYCAIFSDGTAKFGRSTDAWKRLYAHDSDAKRFGRVLSSCFISTVSDSVRDERNLLECAGLKLEFVSRESFKISGPEDAAEIFHDARVPYMFCEMSRGAFGPVITQNSFSTKFDMALGGGGTVGKPSRQERIQVRILKLIDTYSGAVTRAIFKNKLLNYSDDCVTEALDMMVSNGSIVKVPHSGSQCGFRYERGEIPA